MGKPKRWDHDQNKHSLRSKYVSAHSFARWPLNAAPAASARQLWAQRRILDASELGQRCAGHASQEETAERERSLATGPHPKGCVPARVPRKQRDGQFRGGRVTLVSKNVGMFN